MTALLIRVFDAEIVEWEPEPSKFLKVGAAAPMPPPLDADRLASGRLAPDRLAVVQEKAMRRRRRTVHDAQGAML
jgi:hypothetical protein